MSDTNPSRKASSIEAMAKIWQMIGDIMEGGEAVRRAGSRYLPQFEAESLREYNRRLMQAPWQPEFVDILQGLTSKPFSRDIMLRPGASAQMTQIAEDVDRRGNNLTQFARTFFKNSVANGLGVLLVDAPRQRFRTRADELAARARPYLVPIRAEQLLAIYTDIVQGREIVTHLRFATSRIELEGFTEKHVEGVSVYRREPVRNDSGAVIDYGQPFFEHWEKRLDRTGNPDWEMVDAGPISLPELPVVLFWTGERAGPGIVRPPLASLADRQIELYRALSRKEEILTYAGSPILCGQGLEPEGDGGVRIGPRTVLYAPSNGTGTAASWGYIQPAAENLKEIREDCAELVDSIRRLGMQPMTQRSGGVTATASSIDGARSHSALQAWALGLKDALEQAFVYMAQFIGEPASVELVVHTDFMSGVAQQLPLDALHKARANKDISRQTYLAGLQRFDALPPDFDAERDELELAIELQGIEPEAAIDPITGELLADRPLAA